MSKINISLNNKIYSIDESVLASAADELKAHLSNVMSGTGATINLGGTTYNIDSTKLTAATNDFVSHLGTIAGNGSSVTVNGVSYGVDSTKLQGAISKLESALGTLSGGSTPDAPTEERLEGDGAEYYTLAPTALSFRSTAPLNELQEVQINGVTVDPSNYTLEEGSTIVTFPVEYLKTLNVGSYEVTVASQSKTVKGGFNVKAPDLNEHGFYYNQPYSAYVAYPFASDVAFVINENGTVDTIIIGGGTEKCAYTVTGNNITVTSQMGTFNCSVSSDGSEIYCAELATSFKLGEESIASDEDYLYIYDESLGGYVVNCIEKTKSSYGAIKTGINGKPTVKLADFMFYLGTDYEGSLVAIPEIPNSVLSIGDSAFRMCTSLVSITIPDSVTSIGSGAFYGCSSLTSMVIGDSVTSIGSSAFENCSSLESVVIPDSVTSIGYCAFQGCTSFESVVIPDSVTSIGDLAFYGCTNLEKIIFGENSQLISIASGMFTSCGKLTSIIIPSSVTSIDGSPFMGCDKLTNIAFNGTKDQWNAIEKATKWNVAQLSTAGDTYIPATYVQCSDGQVAL